MHGHQQLAQWNAHYDERCFLPIHVYDEATGAPVTVILRPGKTPSGVEVRKLLSHLIGRIRRHWPNTCITIRGDGHYGREEAMSAVPINAAVVKEVAATASPLQPARWRRYRRWGWWGHTKCYREFVIGPYSCHWFPL